jgi:hypothetical protein
MRTITALLAGLGTVAVVGLTTTSAMADTISVDDLAEGEAGAFINVQYDSCGPLPGGENVQVIINGEDTEGRQYALSTPSLRKGETQTFVFHAGRYGITVSSGQFVATADVKAPDVSDTTILMSSICTNVQSPPAAAATPGPSTSPTAKPTTSSARPTTATVRVPNRVETGIAPAGASPTGGAPLREAGIGLGALALVVGGLVAARSRRSAS